MSYIVTFESARPAPRFDGVPFTRVRIDEARTQGGPFGPIDLLALSPPDSDPAHPVPRNLTTANAAIADGWYRLAFIDDIGNVELTSAVQQVRGEMPGSPISEFVVAQDVLRQQFGTPMVFHVPTAHVWPVGVKINPDTGSPYDSTVVPTSPQFTDYTITALVILKQGSPLRPQADTHFDPVGMQSGMDIIIDVRATDWETVSGASEMTVVGLHYKIEEAKVFALGGIVYRYLIYGMQR